MAKNPEDEKIKEVIQRAIDITKVLEEPYRSKAFEILLSKFLSPIAIEGQRQEQEAKAKKAGATTLEGKIEEFAAKCDLSAEQLKNMYDFQEDKPRFTVPLRGNHTENQILASRYLLTAYSEVYDKDWVGLIDPLSEHGVGSLGNLARNLERLSETFRVKGQKRDREYKIVDSAKTETFRMIHELAKNNGQSQLEEKHTEQEEKRGGARKELFSPRIDELIKEDYFKLPNKRKVPDVMKALKEKGLPTTGKDVAILMALKRRLGKTIKGTKEENEWVFWTD